MYISKAYCCFPSLENRGRLSKSRNLKPDFCLFSDPDSRGPIWLLGSVQANVEYSVFSPTFGAAQLKSGGRNQEKVELVGPVFMFEASLCLPATFESGRASALIK